MKLNSEERALLGKLNKKQLVFLSRMAEDADFSVLIDIANYLIDQEKSIFFKEQEFEPQKLAALHAFARGNAAGVVKLLHIIEGSKHELKKRENKDD